MENNTFRFWVSTDRVPFILTEMPEGKVKVIQDCSDRTTEIELSITCGTDVLYLFHAGINCGVAAFTKK
jgi:hypothetical protein